MLGLIALRPAPVEACIALSIVLVASEALREVGLPQNNLAIPLLTFNVGVEIGQLLTVLAAWALTRALARMPVLAQCRTPALYAIGIVAAYWSWLRLAAIG